MTLLALDIAPHGAGNLWRKGSDLISSLPYIDDLTPAEKEVVHKLIEDEAKRSTKRPTDYLKEITIPPLLKFEKNPMLQAEYKRVASGESLPPMDVGRLALPQPPTSKRNDVSAWRAALDNAYSQLEHQYNRLLNLELLLQYGPSVWQAHIKQLEVAVKEVAEERDRLKQEAEGINKERKLKQEAAGRELRSLEEKWLEHVKKNAEIQDACLALEAEIAKLQSTLKQRKGDSGAAVDAMDVEDRADAPEADGAQAPALAQAQVPAHAGAGGAGKEEQSEGR
eukprot:jgi/Botrbrau1/21084/Bobra.0144s0082.1